MSVTIEDATLDWLATTAPGLPGVAEVLEGLSERLLAEGIPLQRTWYGTLPLHPLVYARGWSWRRVGGGDHGAIAHEDRGAISLETTSPIHRVHDGEDRVRVHLEAEDSHYQLLQRLRAAGGTDYVLFAVSGRRGRSCLSFTTDAPGGFDAAQLARMDRVRTFAGLVFQTFDLEALAATLLNTYLGAGPGARVLDGQIRRGDGETLRAATWFCDLRGFTAATETLALPALLELLNEWFAAMVAAVDAHGGEVLKFMGDGMLAAFTHPDARDACRAALAAADEAEARIAAVNLRRDEPLAFGLALHYGDVMYGNIGAPARLDFTVIGPAVNRAARLESLTAVLGRTVILSSTFAAVCGAPVISLGRHALKGVAEPEEVFARAPAAPPAP